jgi:predicted amidohydrolase
LLQAAKADGAQLIATPENSLRLDSNRPRLLSEVAKSTNKVRIDAWANLALELNVWLLMGSGGVQAGPGKVFNRSFLFAPDGTLAAHYDKIHLFDVHLGNGESYRESETVQPGSQAVMTTGPGGMKIGMTVCYDLRFPLLYGALARAGAELITIPSAFTCTTGRAHWETLIRARAIETGAFVIAPAQGGVHDGGRETWGHSMIVNPWGEILASLDHRDPGFVCADIELDQVGQARAKIPAWNGGPAFASP